MAVGETVQVAPRDPDPDAEYRWRIKAAPVSSQLSLGDDPVVDFTPDAAGTFVLELTGPLGVDELTIRVFPGELAPAGRGAGSSGASGQSGMSGVSGVSGGSGISGVSGASGSGSGARGAKREGSGGRPRVTLHGRVKGDTVVVEADPQPNPNSSTPREELDVEFLVDDRWPVDDSKVEIDGWTLTMPKDAFEEKTRVHAVAIDAEYSVADAVEIRVEGTTVDFGDGARTDGGVATQSPGAKQVETGRLYEPPEWSKDITLYEIYVRGFASDDDEAENTFAAIEKRLDYLEGLGVDCLWLTPVLENDHAPHGYNIVDFYDVAADLGDMEAYQHFVDAAHDHGMKVLFDLVLNHSAREHPFFKDAYKNPDSEYYDWYEWQDNGEPGTYFDWEYIANFDHHSLEVRRYLLDAVQQWFEIVDGFRCDMAWAVPFTFWQELRDRVKSQDPDFLLLDETIPYIADFHEGMFDMHFDTTLYFTLRQVGEGHQPADAILDAIDQRTEVGFPDHASFMLYQENHDETRYIVECGDEAAFASAGALFTLPGVPMLYGGQEIGQRGRRDALAWDHAREEVQEHYEHLIETRKRTPALDFRGGIDRVDYEADSEQVTVFRRAAKGQSVVVVLNFGDAPEYVEVDAHVDGTNLVSGENVVDDGTIEVESVVVLEER
ncbi:alpha-amylase MalA [Salinigranum sp. GCM10025319]|uniref:alpha-amylase MalA n=1 Tax=Salinigranum sp. GCM10025319 TaxID=3252687 RepID=UPI00361A499C